ncbi:GNAT family N-acetyltransferase [Isobaculum melis]|uniref:Acetyltransferase (GNAT) family protein n=1 Tax=Isobaculum melis TaxID=142588 RepID=A0A1H9U0N2_9LACT|nr:GNAT family N-acetyltransferase [Isobaculum melis]SES02828.1 Acetyltransferase (GNAT) family protein [Isobaculum melis]
MTLKIIPATQQEDALLVAALAKEIWEEHYTDIIGADQVAYMLTHLQSGAHIYQDMQSDMIYWLLKDEMGPIGYAAYRLEEESLFLSKLYLVKRARNQGFAKQVFHEMVTIAQENQLTTITLTVNKYNSSSIAAYQKMGFITLKEQVADIGGGYVMDDFVLIYNI